jgi:hypothetical protein
MKYITSLLLLMTMSISNLIAAEISPEELERKKLVELNIQYIKTWEYKFKFGVIDKTSAFLTQAKTYNKIGFLIEERNYNREPGYKEYNNTITNIYDKNNNLIKTIEKNYKEVITDILVFKYENGLLKEKIGYNCDGKFTGKVVYEYDSLINIGFKSFDENGKLEGYSQCIHNINKKIEEIIHYDVDSTISTREEYTYFGDNEIEFKIFNSENKLSDGYKEKTNNIGQCVEYIYYKDSDSKEITTYKYNSNNLKIESTETYNDIPQVYTKISYTKFQPENPTATKKSK